MKLYLMRHGQSPSVTDAGVPRDFDRPLSDTGKADVKRVAERIAAKGGKPQVILHSPLTRAAQTAATAAAVLKPSPKVQAYEPLSNTLGPEQLLEILKPEFDRYPEILAVGHQPQVGELAVVLTGEIFDFKPGGLIAIELSGKNASVLWSCNPQDLPAR